MPSGCAPILTSFISITTSSACSRCDENELRTTYAGMLGACEQANLVANEAKLIEPANAIIAFNCHLTHGHAGHAPDGQISHFLSSPSAKNIPLLRRPKSLLYPRHPVPLRGAFRDRHGRRARDAVDAAASGAHWQSQGGSWPVSDQAACRRQMLVADGKAVWSWHPLLVSSWRRLVSSTGSGKT